MLDVTSNKPKFTSEGLNKPVLEESGNVPMEKYRRVLGEKVYVTSNNIRFRTNNHSAATFEQVNKSPFDFYPTQKVESDGNRTQPDILWEIHSFFKNVRLCNRAKLYILIKVFNYNIYFFYITFSHINIRTLEKSD